MNKEYKENLLITVFFLGGTIGGIWETLWTYLVRGSLQWKSGVMFFPLCNPIYGLGALLITLYALKHKSLFSIYIFALISCTISEFLFSYLEELLFNTISWDYSSHFLNLDGRVNLIYSLFWGLLGIIFAHFILPPLECSVAINGEKYQSLTFTLCVIYIPLLFFSIVGLAVNHYGTTNEILSTIFSEKIMKFFYPTRVLVIK